jgi:UrcA family protein
MQELTQKVLAAISAVALAATVTAPAWGKEAADPIDVQAPVDPGEYHTTYVSYDDLDLTTVRGEDALRGRVRGAARDVCPDDLMVSNKFGCRRIARQSAEPKIARAVRRAHQIAMTGTSDIAPVRITLLVR